MKEKFKKFMIQGGLAVIIAVVAMSLYLTALYFGNKYFEKATEPAKLAVKENGEIYLDGFEKDKSETIYIMWETDGGNIKAKSKNDIFKAQAEDSFNKNYIVNTNYDESVIWNPDDADGEKYGTATVRAVVYSYDKEINEDPYYMGTYVNEYTITVSNKGEKTEKADSRFFGNPVRDGADTDWNNIYKAAENKETVTYRYRTGNVIDEKHIVLCFEDSSSGEKNILSETDYEKGMYYCNVKEDNSHKNLLVGVTNVTVYKKDMGDILEGGGSVSLRAYLISEEMYNKAIKGTVIDEKEKMNIAGLEIVE